MIEISAISARRLPIPNGCDFYFIATASIGDASVSSAPAKPVVDHRLGSSVTFRDPLVLPCYVDGSVVDIRTFGISVQIRSVCGTMHLGTAVCRVSRQWSPVVPTGEVMVSFSLSEPVTSQMPSASASENVKKQRPATAGPAVRSSALDAPAKPAGDVPEDTSVVSEYSGMLTVQLKSIQGLSISTANPVSLYVSAQFALEETTSQTIEIIPEADGHRGKWLDGKGTLSFELLPSNVSRIMTLSVFGAWVKGSMANVNNGPGPHHLLGICKVDIPTNLGGESQQFTTAPSISGHPRSRLDLSVSLTYIKPRKEGAGGRPLSAYPRRTPATAVTTVDAVGPQSHHRPIVPAASPTKQRDENSEDENQLRVANHTSAAKLRTKVGAGRKAWSEESIDAGGRKYAFQAALFAKLEETVQSAVNGAVAKVLERVTLLEQRVQRTEEMLGQIRPPSGQHLRPNSAYGNAKIPKAPTTILGAASRPSSADSVTGASGGYDVSHSIVTDTQLRNKFNEYDIKGRGSITVPQLIQFYRANSPFGDDDDEVKILKYFEYCGIKVRSSEGVSFDEFARLALKLAQR